MTARYFGAAQHFRHHVQANDAAFCGAGAIQEAFAFLHGCEQRKNCRASCRPWNRNFHLFLWELICFLWYKKKIM